MEKKHIKKRSDCPCSSALDILGDKWTLLLIRDMALRQKSTYGEFLAAEESISTNILADRLARMASEKIIVKKKNAEDKRKDSYILTDKGLDLVPLCIEFFYWGAKHDKKTSAPREFKKSTQKSRAKLSKKVITTYIKSLK